MNRSTPPAERIFADALAQPPAERSAFLAKACGANVDLLAHLVALVAAHEMPDSLLHGSHLRQGVSGQVALPREPLKEEKPGDTIGHYKLLQKIGEGGCGVVWMAEQEEPVRRRVALKVIKLGMDTKAVVARFEAERQALAMMDHPCIAKVHDAGSTDTGRPFFVMELVRGIPITKYCDENHLTPTARLELFIKVCQAIQHAHQKGVIHRDIKPSNILVTVNDGAPTPKVIDFGIAKATQGKLTDATVFTAFEQFIGTPVYMSPEQAEMSSLDIDTRSDVYSLGVLLYELLTGRPPFDPKKFAQAGVDQIRKQIREVEPPRPSARLKTLDADERTTIAQLRGTAESQLSIALRGDLDWIVMRCIEKDRTRRYDTANGLAMDIQRYLRNEPVVARPPSSAYLLQKLIRRNRVAFVGGVAVAGVLVVGAAVATWQAFRARRAESIAEAARAGEAGLRRNAQQQEHQARLQAYAGDMNLAYQAIRNHDLVRAGQLLARSVPAPGAQDLRGWEWRYLWQFSKSDPHTVVSRLREEALSLSVSADGNWVAAGDYSGGLLVKHLRTGEEQRMRLGDGRVAVAFSPTGPLLVASSVDAGDEPGSRRGFLILWDLTQKRVARRIDLAGEWSAGAWTSLHFSPDGGTLVSSSLGPNHRVTWWRMPEASPMRDLRLVQPRGGYLANAFATSRDLRWAAHHTPDQRQIQIVDLQTGQERWMTAPAPELAAAMAFSPDGSLLATASAYGEPTIRLWDVRTGAEVGVLRGHRRWVSALLFFPDGRTLVSGGGDGTIRLWEVPTRTLTKTLRGHQREVLSLALLPDNATLISGGRDGTVRVWDTQAHRPTSEALTFPEPLISWQFRPDSRSLRTLERNGVVAERRGSQFEERNALLQIPDLGLTGEGVPALNYYALFSGDARFLAVGSVTGTVRVWDLEQRTMWREFRSSSLEQNPALFLDGNTRLVVGERFHSRYREYDLVSGREVAWWPGPEEFSRLCTAGSPDSRFVLMIGWDGNAILRNRQTGQVETFNLNLLAPEGPRFSPDGRFFASGSQRGSPKIWETANRREIAELTGSIEINSVAFSPDASRLATGASAEDAIRIWDLESHQPLLTLPAHGSLFRPLLFSPDGNTIGAASLGGILHLWRAPTWEEIEAAEKTQANTSP